jgi:histidinol-phosphate/aromatic aminotransferase/cobyric acid decarboxylase-like protein
MIAHGAFDYDELAALGIDPSDLLDFSSNLNPFGPPAAVRVALAELDPAPYPDRSCRRLRLALAARHDCPPTQILLGNGANELIHLIARALLGPGDMALVVGPTFGEYANASQLVGAQLVEWRANEQEQFLPDLDALAAAIARFRPRLTWLCVPNNPSGINLSADSILRLAAACADIGGLLVVDRAYAGFLSRPHLFSPPLPKQEIGERLSSHARGEGLGVGEAKNLLHLHSLTKSYALAGLRLGYLLADPALITRISAYQPAWSVSSAAQAAGLAALADPDFLSASLPRIWAASDELRDGLLGLGLVVHRAELPFLLVRSGDAAATRAALLRRGCLVRDCTSFGLSAWVRVAPRRPEQNKLLLQVWEETL